jgi:ATPase subunit of ABC transporter with duplicated ATPase domains
MLFNEEVSITLGNKVLITPSLIQIQENEKYALVGPNGVGKTTLMNYIYEKIKNTHNVLYVKQSEKIEDDCTVYQYMLKADYKLFTVFQRNCELEEIINDENVEVTDKIFEESKLCCDILKQNIFSSYNSRIQKILAGLGFENNVQINLLSGGQHTKLSLARSLLLEPTILFLDEPSNHLDLNNIIWLEDYLADYKKSLVVISHNIDFFDNVANKIIYFFGIDPISPRVYMCKGGYHNFIKVFEQKKNDYINEYEKFCKRVQELSKKNTPESKTKLDEYIAKNSVNRPIRDFDIRIKFNEVKYPSTSAHSNIISFENVDFGYDSKLILENINIGISMMSRYILVGENGSGKTTFFKLCRDELKPLSGEITRDRGLRIGYFDQQSITKLNNDISPLDYLKLINNSLSEQECRSILAKIGFKKMYEGDIFNVSKLLISELSGGQKVKLVLAGIQITNPHIIFLDEPGNHLDIFSIDEFISAINSFNGGIVIITHDRYIIEHIENYELLILKNNAIDKYNADFSEYCKEISN